MRVFLPYDKQNFMQSLLFFNAGISSIFLRLQIPIVLLLLLLLLLLLIFYCCNETLVSASILVHIPFSNSFQMMINNCGIVSSSGTLIHHKLQTGGGEGGSGFKLFRCAGVCVCLSDG